MVRAKSVADLDKILVAQYYELHFHFQNIAGRFTFLRCSCLCLFVKFEFAILCTFRIKDYINPLSCFCFVFQLMDELPMIYGTCVLIYSMWVPYYTSTF